MGRGGNIVTDCTCLAHDSIGGRADRAAARLATGSRPGECVAAEEGDDSADEGSGNSGVAIMRCPLTATDTVLLAACSSKAAPKT